jgi:hypothetical protein
MLLSILALLGTVGLVGLSAAAMLWGRVRGQTGMTRGALGLLLATLGGYALLLVGAGLSSRDRVLGADEEKYFCELDCHLAYRVMAIRPFPAGAGAGWAVTLRTRFDPRTISSHRGDGPLTPNPRRVWLITSAGTRVAPLAGSSAVAMLAGPGVRPLTEPLRPGESYETVLLFPAVAGAEPSSVLVEDDVWPDRLLIGHEASPFHGRTLLPLPAAGSMGVSHRDASAVPTPG